MKELLKNYRVVKPGDDATHLSMGSPTGRFYVSCSDYERFMDAFAALLAVPFNRSIPSLVELHRHVGPVIIDIDLRQPPECTERLYTAEDVSAFIASLCVELGKLVDAMAGSLPSPNSIFVLEKPAPRCCGNTVKDGFHVQLPSIVTRPEVQELLRVAMLPHVSSIFGSGSGGHIGYTNSVEDMYDEAVLRRNGWMMYGAKKPDEPWPWRVTRVYSYSVSDGCTRTTLDWDGADGSLASKEDDPVTFYAPPGELARLLSIRRCDIDEAPLTAYGVAELEKVLKAEREALVVRLGRGLRTCKRSLAHEERLLACRTPLNNDDNDTESLTTLVSLLSAERAEAYKSWLEVGLALHNATTGSEAGLDLWLQFSRLCREKSEGNEHKHERIWDNFGTRKDGDTVGIGSLRYWAKLDSPEAYHIWATRAATTVPLVLNKSCKPSSLSLGFHPPHSVLCVAMMQQSQVGLRSRTPQRG